MNDINSVIRKIEADAQLAVQEIAEASQAEVAQIKADYEKQAAEIKAQIKKETGAKLETIRLRGQSQADLTERGLKLTYRRKVMTQAFDMALQELASMEQEKYRKFLLRQIVKCQTQDGVLVLNAKDKQEIGPQLVQEAQVATGKNLVLAEEAGQFSGGFLLKEGSIENNCTFEVLMTAIREEIEGSVAAALFR